MLHIFTKCITKNLFYIFTFVFQFLCVADYMKCINETTTPIEMSTGFVDSVLRPKSTLLLLLLLLLLSLLLLFYLFQ